MNISDLINRYKPENRSFPIIIVFAIAFIIRIIHLNSYTSYPAFDFPVGGHTGYIMMALKILDGDILGGTEIFYDNSPIYYYILAGMFKIFGIDFYAIRFVQILIGSLNCYLIALIAFHYFGLTAALVSGIIAAFYGPFIFYDAEIIVLPWVLFFCLLAILIIVKNNAFRNIYWVYSGILIGAAVMGRPNLILFPVLLLLYFLYGKAFKKNLPQRLRSYVWLCMGILLFPSIFLIRNYAVSGEVHFLNPSAGHNFYFGHKKDASPYFNESLIFRGAILLKYKEIAESHEKRTLTAGEVSDYWHKKGLANIMAHPYDEFKLALKKTLYFFSDQVMPTYFNYYFNRNYSVVLKRCALTFGFIFPLAILGFFLTRENASKLMVIYLFFLTSFFSVILIFVIERLRIPGVPVVIIFSSIGLIHIFKKCMEKAFKPLILAAIIIAPLYWMTFTPLVHMNYAHNYNLIGVALWQKGHIQEAEKAFLEALNKESGFEFPLLNLIQMFDEMGDKAKENAYREKHETLKDRFGSINWDTEELTKYIRPYR